MAKCVRTFKLFPDTEEVARRGGPHVFEGWEYYCTPRAYHPRSAKALTWSSVDRIATFDALAAVDLIAPRPLLMIVGREAVTSWMSVQAFQRALGPKELRWIDGAMHNDLYDKEQYVGSAVTKLTGFFTKNLARDTTGRRRSSADEALADRAQYQHREIDQAADDDDHAEQEHRERRGRTCPSVARVRACDASARPANRHDRQREPRSG